MTLLNYLHNHQCINFFIFFVYVVLRTLNKISIKWFSVPCGLLRSKQCKYTNWNLEYRCIYLY